MTMHGAGNEAHGSPAQVTDPDGTPSPEQGTPEINEDKQYSGKEVRAILSADGRKQKDRAEAAEASLKLITGEHETLKTQFNTVSGQVSQLLKAQDDAELAQYSEDKPAQDQLRVKQANRAEAIRLEGVEAANKAREAKATERETEVAKSEASVNIKLAAMSGGVDEVELADLVPDGNSARLKKAVDILKKRGPTDAQLRGGKLPGLGQRPASAISAGGGLGDLSPDDKITRGLALKKK